MLSLAVPGAGQLWCGRRSALVDFTVAAALAALPQTSTAGRVLSWVVLAALALLSAERAKRCVEAGKAHPARGRGAVRSRVIDRSGSGQRISVGIELHMARPSEEVWAIVADVCRFVTIDPFHARVIVLGPALAPGVPLALEHQALGVKFLRFGRLLSWREGRGYAISDLSGFRGARGFFPHVFDFSVEPAEVPGWTAATRLTVRIRRRWTSRWAPRWAGRWWVRLVSREHARLLQMAFS